jgi:hypothetical protein
MASLNDLVGHDLDFALVQPASYGVKKDLHTFTYTMIYQFICLSPLESTEKTSTARGGPVFEGVGCAYTPKYTSLCSPLVFFNMFILVMAEERKSFQREHLCRAFHMCQR